MDDSKVYKYMKPALKSLEQCPVGIFIVDFQKLFAHTERPLALPYIVDFFLAKLESLFHTWLKLFGESYFNVITFRSLNKYLSNTLFWTKGFGVPIKKQLFKGGLNITA